MHPEKMSAAVTTSNSSTIGWLQDALEYLDAYFCDENYRQLDSPIEMRSRLCDLYDAQRERLQTMADAEQVTDNSKLDKLRTLLVDLYKSDDDARGTFH